ncbi:MAG: DUF3308 domain-containing protein [Calditrichaeota bacterium]|nr:MAG: DUF3308 domain-containing protein [Calditrichota bacterium]
MKYKIILAGIVFIGFLAAGKLQAQTKLAQTGFQFLSVGQSARAVALGEAFTTMSGTANDLFYNPAGIAEIKHTVDVNVNLFTWIADIRHASMAATFTPSNGEYGVFGVSFQSVDYGDLEGTMVWTNAQGYIETGTFNPRATAIGFSYARTLTDRFSVGGQIKLVGQYLGNSSLPSGVTKENTANVLAMDFGTIYKTGFKSLVFGMSVRNFSQEIKYEVESFQLPLTFRIGLAMNAGDFFLEDDANQELWVSIDASHPRSYDEYLNFGLEYNFRQLFFVRTGYITNQSENSVSFGFGVSQFGFTVDYAYQPFGVFGAINRFSAGFSF